MNNNVVEFSMIINNARDLEAFLSVLKSKFSDITDTYMSISTGSLPFFHIRIENDSRVDSWQMEAECKQGEYLVLELKDDEEYDLRSSTSCPHCTSRQPEVTNEA